MDFTRLSDLSCQVSLAINFSKLLCNIFLFLPSHSSLLKNRGLGEAGGKDRCFSGPHALSLRAQGLGEVWLSAADLGAGRKG